MSDNKGIPPAGNRSLLKIAKIAKMHHVKLIVPATIYIGQSLKNFLIYTDIVTGYIKIKEDHLSPSDIENFINDHMTP